MTKLLIKWFIKGEDLDPNVKKRKYDGLASGVGIITNIAMAVVKLVVGLMLNSVSIMADAMNLAMDSLTNLMVIVTGRLARKPADSEHPFGHAKLEYVSTFIIAMLMLLLAYEFIQSSIAAIINPEPLGFDVVLLGILFATAVVKVWQSLFYKHMGHATDSEPFIALSRDSFNDVLISIAIITSVIFTYLTGIVIDGYIGLVISLIILHAGLMLAKDTISKLLGESVNADEAQKILAMVKSYDEVLGAHDLIVHNYGNVRMATIFIDVSDRHSLKEIHIIVDRIEREVEKELAFDEFIIRLTPIPEGDQRFIAITGTVGSFIAATDQRLNANDYKIIEHKMGIDVIFDLDFPFDYCEEKARDVIATLTNRIKALDSDYQPIIQVNRYFVSMNETVV